MIDNSCLFTVYINLILNLNLKFFNNDFQVNKLMLKILNHETFLFNENETE